MPTIHGAILSPFVRKVRVACAEKGIEYDVNPVVPFGNAEFKQNMNPLGKIPVLEDDGELIPDSSVIVAYLERAHPQRPLYPADPKLFARALFLEEYADTKLIEATGPHFQQNVLSKLFRRPPVQAAIDAAIALQPEIFGYLEGRIQDPAAPIVGDSFSIADIAVASPFVNFFHGGGSIPADAYPKLASFVATVHARTSFKPLIEEERGVLPA